VIESLPAPPALRGGPRRVESSERARQLARATEQGADGERSVASALQRTYSVGQRLLLDRAELFVRDARDQFVGVGRGVLLAGLGGGVALAAWIALMGATVLWLSTSFSVPESIATVGGVNLAIAAVLVWGASRAIRSGS
jgi:hypothetical protein